MYRVFSDWQNKCYLILVVLFPYCKKEYPLLNMLIAVSARPSYPEQTCVFCSTEALEGRFSYGLSLTPVKLRRQKSQICFFRFCRSPVLSYLCEN